jgi:hypothetical protein
MCQGIYSFPIIFTSRRPCIDNRPCKAKQPRIYPSVKAVTNKTPTHTKSINKKDEHSCITTFAPRPCRSPQPHRSQLRARSRVRTRMRLQARHARPQVIVLTRRKAEDIRTLIQRRDAAHALDKLFTVSTISQPKHPPSALRPGTHTVEIKLSSPFLSLELSHHMPPPRPISRIIPLLRATTSGVSYETMNRWAAS